MKHKRSPMQKKILRILGVAFTCILLTLSFLSFFSARWYINTYGQLGFDSIIFTLLGGLNGVESDLVNSYVQAAVYPTLYWAIPLCLFLFLPCRKKLILMILPKIRLRLFPCKRVFGLSVSLVLSLCLLFFAAQDVELFDYLVHISANSSLYQESYQDPAAVDIQFPEQKRNLIYIFLESMETTYFSKEQGGFLDYCVAPELYDLAQNNISFSPSDTFGGLYAGNGSTWTIGAMVAHTAGIPLKTPPSIGGNDYGPDGNFLPGITSITDILHDQGYSQALIVGSDPTFGGRQHYYTSHGTDYIFSIFSAWAEGFVPKDYYEWWGIEDRKLFEYAKQKITAAAAGEQPFAYTLLTVDTHHVDGYLCPDCIEWSSIQYENVIACSSRKVAEFVSWVQAQDFYENTTIVIVGDHPTMDNGYIQTIGAESFDRRVYNCFINSAVQTANTKNRVAFTVDMFPTTLAAMGCTIEGDRLGLGTNLFSDTPTLGEEMGLEAFDTELGKRSSYYTKNFFFAE